MNKEQMARKLSEKMDISLVESRTYINTILDIMVEGLETEEYVSIYGFGRIFLQPQLSRLARNPRTGEGGMLIPRNTVRLKPSRDLLDKLNKTE